MRSLLTTVVGNIATRPTLLEAEPGKETLAFRLAVDCSYFDSSTNQWQEKPAQFMTVYARKELARNASESLNKGERVIVHGRLSTSQWQDDDGNERFSLALSAEALGPDLRWAKTTYQRITKRDQLGAEYQALKDVLPRQLNERDGAASVVLDEDKSAKQRARDAEKVPF